VLQGKGVAAIDIGARNLIALIGVDSEGNTFSLLFKSGTPRAYWLKCGKLARRRQKSLTSISGMQRSTLKTMMRRRRKSFSVNMNCI